MMNSIGWLKFSATDLTNFLGCKHAAELDRELAHGRIQSEFRSDPTLDLLIELGNRHEKNYLDYLRAQGGVVVEIPKFEDTDGALTAKAMRDGVDVIVQASLVDLPWRGFADFLIRVEQPSELGAWSYEAADTKLSQTTKAAAVIQLCLYTEILAKVQGIHPQFMYVVKPRDNASPLPFSIDRLRVNDFMAYYRMAKREFASHLSTQTGISGTPEPCNHCQFCNWWPRCNKEWRDADHLSFVAGISKSQRIALGEQGIRSLTQFAEADKPLLSHPQRGSSESYNKIHRQAKIQLKGRVSGKPEFEFNDVVKDRGLALLPAPDPGDIFFDLEGNPRAGHEGLEYLFGYITVDSGHPQYRSHWSFNFTEERIAFEQFMDFVRERRKLYPSMHIYHYAPYEPSALKRLMTKHSTREDEVDDLLRSNRFIDLYAVTRQAIRASVESYSIKQLEPFYGFQRQELLESARKSLMEVERFLALELTSELTDAHKKSVVDYNEDDCLSTLRLRNWLEQLRTDRISAGIEINRPQSTDPKEQVDIEDSHGPTPAQVLFGRLTSGLAPDDLSEIDRIKWRLAHLLEYFRREDKSNWWEFFRMHELEHEELLSERTALTGLTFVSEVPGPPKAKNPTHRYTFPPQECALSTSNPLYEVQGNEIGTIAELDMVAGFVDIRKRGDSLDVHPQSVFFHERYQPEPMPESILRFAEELLVDIESGKPIANSARIDLLAQRPPRTKTLQLPLNPRIKNPATTLAFDLDNSLLAIQGPPGTGKTHIGSEMISELAAAGKRIGITAVSHKVITNLLVRTQARSNGRFTFAQRTSRDDLPDSCRRISKSPDVLAAIERGEVVGGTAWVWAREDLEQQLDYLFVDEAGQMSLAMVLAAARSAKNVVLLGDPQQLEQPRKGSHPEGAEVAALKHVLAGSATIPPDRGLFLNYTWRMHPSISKYISQQFYDDRLVSRYGLERQAILGSSHFVGSGLFYVPVEHEGCQSICSMEARIVKRICESLSTGHRWRDADGIVRELLPTDILVVAPYNAQVSEIKKTLSSSVRVGTVDRFQGQEAPVLIYSLTSSSIEDSPRGMEFLFSPNRLNVAVSRARCISILVGNPLLFVPSCTSPDQLRWANAFADYFLNATRLFTY
ncbi:MAG: TM0106 family RecB-like putative nuclease [Planctomycetales bacterium]|nr:TM0106 family RecB-like putative nuclease [Planctomycetales bacterium]